MSKRALVSKLIQDVRSSYWFVPTLFALGAIALSQVMLFADRHTDSLGHFLPRSWRLTQVEGARSILAVVAQSTIGVAGVMFSITVVAVSFASGNFGPRLIGNFMRDRGTQVSLGILIATFMFSLFALQSVQSPAEGAATAFVPHLSMVVALVLTLCSIFSMIYYIHHVPELINVSNISAALGRRLDHDVQARIDAHEAAGAAPRGAWPDRAPDDAVASPSSGYIQTWDKSNLLALARDNDLHVRVVHNVGSFVGPSSTLIEVWCAAPLSQDLRTALCDCFALGAVRTETQDMFFLVDQLIEMTARALSPGVNDPFTAINCLNWLYVGCARAANYKGGLRDHPQARLKAVALTFETLLDRSFRQGADYIKPDPLASDHLKSLLDRLASEVRDPRHRAAVKALQAEVCGG